MTDDLAAAMLGRLLDIGVGLLIIVPCAGVAKEDCVATDDVELDRVGDDGRKDVRGAGGGEGAIIGLEDVRWWLPEFGNGDGGATMAVGVAIGVFCDDEIAELLTIDRLDVGISSS